MKFIIFLLITICILFSSVWSKTLFVAPDGNDSVTRTDNNIINPWQSPSKSWSSSGAIAGDTVYYREGIYNISSQIVAGNSGNQNNWIIHKSYNNESVTFNATGSWRTGNGYSTFLVEESYIKVESIHFLGGARVFNLGYDANGSANFFIASNCTFQNWSGGDNVAPIYVYDDFDDVVMEYCEVIGPGLGSEGVHGNTAGIVAFNTERLKVINNEISKVPIGIYYKHGNRQTEPGIEISYNYITDTDRYAMEINCSYAKINDNIFGPNNTSGALFGSVGVVRFNEGNGGPGGRDCLIEHNTFYNTSLFLAHDEAPFAKNNIVHNNIFTYEIAIYPYSGADHNTDTDYNLYVSGNAVWNAGNHYSANEWGDPTFFTGSPTFQGGANPSEIPHFALTSNSIGYKAGSDQKDLGADVLKVGLTGKSSNPKSPTSVRIKK